MRCFFALSAPKNFQQQGPRFPPPHLKNGLCNLGMYSTCTLITSDRSTIRCSAVESARFLGVHDLCEERRTLAPCGRPPSHWLNIGTQTERGPAAWEGHLPVLHSESAGQQYKKYACWGNKAMLRNGLGFLCCCCFATLPPFSSCSCTPAWPCATGAEAVDEARTARNRNEDGKER